MIVGVVTPAREATIPVAVQDPHGQEHSFSAVIDTGFTGHLTLPPAVIASLGLSFAGRQQVILGDGSIELFDVYTRTVMWDGQSLPVEIDAADTDALVGMALIYGFERNIRAVDGGSVTLTRF